MVDPYPNLGFFWQKSLCIHVTSKEVQIADLRNHANLRLQIGQLDDRHKGITASSWTFRLHLASNRPSQDLGVRRGVCA